MIITNNWLAQGNEQAFYYYTTQAGNPKTKIRIQLLEKYHQVNIDCR